MQCLCAHVLCFMFYFYFERGIALGRERNVRDQVDYQVLLQRSVSYQLTWQREAQRDAF